MPTLAEMIAARKAKAAPPEAVQQPIVEASTKQTGDGFTDALHDLASKAAIDNIAKPVPNKTTVAIPVVQEPVLAEPKKVLSFAEILAQKKAAASAIVQTTSAVPAVSARVFDLPVAEPVAEKRVVAVPSKAIAPTFMQKLIPAASKQADDEDLAREEYLAAPADVQEGYRDIKHKVYALAEYDDSALEEPMSQLKRALLANPNACLLMLDEDIGKMTIALRRLVQESLVEVVKEKKVPKDKKTLSAPLTPEQMQKVFDEL